MLLNYEVNGYKIFDVEINFSMLANSKVRRLNENVVLKEFEKEKFGILKSAIVYGPNNSGKTTFINSIELLKKIIEKESIKEVCKDKLIFNFFEDKKEIDYKIEFINNNNIYSYELLFSHEAKIMKEILIKNDEKLFDRKGKNDVDVQSVIDLLDHYDDKLLVLSLPKKHRESYLEMKDFFDRLKVVKYKEEDFKETIDVINNPIYKEDFLNIIKKSDTNIKSIDLKKDEGITKHNNIPKEIEDYLKLESTYEKNGKVVSFPSLLVDSQGTKKLMVYATFIIKALRENQILIIDELDSSWHSILTRNIFALFNSKSNKESQLIATCHDLLLLDDERMFRKDQIWFSYKEKSSMYFYSLDNIAINPQIRTSALKEYLKGKYGALPYPDIGGIVDDEK